MQAKYDSVLVCYGMANAYITLRFESLKDAAGVDNIVAVWIGRIVRLSERAPEVNLHTTHTRRQRQRQREAKTHRQRGPSAQPIQHWFGTMAGYLENDRIFTELIIGFGDEWARDDAQRQRRGRNQHKKSADRNKGLHGGLDRLEWVIDD